MRAHHASWQALRAGAGLRRFAQTSIAARAASSLDSLAGCGSSRRIAGPGLGTSARLIGALPARPSSHPSVLSLLGRAPQLRTLATRARSPTHARRKRNRTFLALGIALGLGVAAYWAVPPFQLFVLAVQRCSRVGIAVVSDIIDYKLLFRKSWPGEEEQDTERGRAARKQRHEDYENTHRRCAERILAVLKANGGIYVKLGQHLSSIQLVPEAWSSTMRPLQDECTPTSYEDVAQLFLTDMGRSIDTLFSEFDREPIGVASLAQVHVAVDRETGRRVAVKLMHPELEDFARIDMLTTRYMVNFVKRIFPNFEFTWLADEMEANLPLEMDFQHEAANARRCQNDFAGLKSTSLVIPEIKWSRKRILVMEFIEGARLDDLEYLRRHSIDRNKVAQELSRIFSRMILVTGFMHTDPHAGNALIRPRQPSSRSPHNFEIVLLDFGLCTNISKELRINYARLWLSLMATNSAKTQADRRRYAKLVGNIDDSQFRLFESALTGRPSMGDGAGAGAGSILDLATQTPEEAHKLREAVIAEDLILDIFAILRQVPPDLLMILKLKNVARLIDLTRSLDHALETTHPPMRIWLIFGSQCAATAYADDLEQLRAQPLTPSRLFATFRAWWSYRTWTVALAATEWGADLATRWTQLLRYFRGDASVAV